jgi:hypothetical protein
LEVADSADVLLLESDALEEELSLALSLADPFSLPSPDDLRA